MRDFCNLVSLAFPSKIQSQIIMKTTKDLRAVWIFSCLECRYRGYKENSSESQSKPYAQLIVPKRHKTLLNLHKD